VNDPNNIKATLIANISITDTSTHTYRTDPYNQKTNTGIMLLDLLHRDPRPEVIGIFVYNNENQQLTAQVIENMDNSGNFPDINLGSSTPVSAGDATKLLIYTSGTNATPVDFLSIALSFATAPTTGNVQVYVRPYDKLPLETSR